MENSELPGEELKTITEITEAFQKVRMEFIHYDFPNYLETKDFSNLTSEELDTDYDLIFDMHQELFQNLVRMNGLDKYKQRLDYQESQRGMERIIFMLSHTLEVILNASVERTYRQGFI